MTRLICKFCGASLESKGIPGYEKYGCGREVYDGEYRTPKCYQREIDDLKALMKELLLS
jgi:tRNA(Ile2) C34 agmatinyltransferase TiaS